MNSRRVFKRVPVVFCIATAAACFVLHVGTFVTLIPPIWSLLPFALIALAALLASAAGLRRGFASPHLRRSIVVYGLVAYAVLTFVYVYRTSGGASRVSIVDGQYVAMYKDRVLRTITERGYRMFPNLWSRVMSAWIGMMAVLLWLGHLSD